MRARVAATPPARHRPARDAAAGQASATTRQGPRRAQAAHKRPQSTAGRVHNTYGRCEVSALQGHQHVHNQERRPLAHGPVLEGVSLGGAGQVSGRGGWTGSVVPAAALSSGAATCLPPRRTTPTFRWRWRSRRAAGSRAGGGGCASRSWWGGRRGRRSPACWVSTPRCPACFWRWVSSHSAHSAARFSNPGHTLHAATPPPPPPTPTAPHTHISSHRIEN